MGLGASGWGRGSAWSSAWRLEGAWQLLGREEAPSSPLSSPLSLPCPAQASASGPCLTPSLCTGTEAPWPWAPAFCRGLASFSECQLWPEAMARSHCPPPSHVCGSYSTWVESLCVSAAFSYWPNREPLRDTPLSPISHHRTRHPCSCLMCVTNTHAARLRMQQARVVSLFPAPLWEGVGGHLPRTRLHPPPHEWTLLPPCFHPVNLY